MEKKKYSTFAVIFYINKGKVKKSGQTTIMGRISINGEIAQFSTKIDVEPQQWDAKIYRLKGRGQAVVQTNQKLEELTKKITEYHAELLKQYNYVTAEQIKNMVLGIGQKQTTLLTLLSEHNEQYRKMIGITRVAESIKVYEDAYNLLSEFIQKRYHRDDIELKELNYSFIEKFDYYMRINRGYSPNTVRKIIIIPKKMGRLAVDQGLLRFNPFAEFIAERPPKKHRHMTAEEFAKMVSTPIDCPMTRHTRDMFVFSTFSGVSFVDMIALTEENIKMEGDVAWLNFKRQKTGTECHIRLLDIAREILGKYRSERKDGRLFNIMRYGKTDIYLKKAAKLCGIENNITYHQSRHNFATIITLSNGVPLETVSRMMGHTDIRTTQLYARLTNQKIDEDMKILSKSIKGDFKIYNDKNIGLTKQA
ncbi:MAG: site-specific integrase [Rikenellaceae bacterium]